MLEYEAKEPRRVAFVKQPMLPFVGWALLFVLVTILIIGFLAWSRWLPPPEPEGRVVPSPNGYDAIHALLPAFTPLPAKSPILRSQSASPVLLRKALQADWAALKRLRAALRHEHLAPPLRTLYGNPYDTDRLRGISRRLVAAATLAQAERRSAEAMAYALDAVELGSRIGRGTYLTPWDAETILGVKVAESILPSLTPAEARAARARLERIIRQTPTVTEYCDEERRWALAAFREFATGRWPLEEGDPDLGKPPYSDPWTVPGLRLRAFLAFYPRSWTYNKLNAYFRAHMAEVRKPFPQRRFPTLEQDPFCEFLADSRAHVDGRFTMHETRLHLLRLALALQEHRGRHGHYPEKLAELSVLGLGGIPMDPFTGREFGYRKKGKGYVLYSAGPDGVDDGGRPVDLKSVNSRLGDVPSPGFGLRLDELR